MWAITFLNRVFDIVYFLGRLEPTRGESSAPCRRDLGVAAMRVGQVGPNKVFRKVWSALGWSGRCSRDWKIKNGFSGIFSEFKVGKRYEKSLLKVGCFEKSCVSGPGLSINGIKRRWKSKFLQVFGFCSKSLPFLGSFLLQFWTNWEGVDLKKQRSTEKERDLLKIATFVEDFWIFFVLKHTNYHYLWHKPTIQMAILSSKPLQKVTHLGFAQPKICICYSNFHCFVVKIVIFGTFFKKNGQNRLGIYTYRGTCEVKMIIWDPFCVLMRFLWQFALPRKS